MENNLIVGIDPGAKGAIVSITPAPKPIIVKWPIPSVCGRVDFALIGETIERLASPVTHFYIEDVHAIFGTAAGSTFSFGFVCGAIRAFVIHTKCRYTLVQPKAWQKEVYQGIPEIRKSPIRIKRGKRAGKITRGPVDTKAMSLMAAKRLFPDVDLLASERCKKPHDGIVDALLIAEYGCRRCYTMKQV